ncbi:MULTISPECIES: ATP/GTP-binding protein [unclassified Streptomyces]|uniref:ATP/GTP-binding protein n=1 Tax=unclassified Streptomyces TaxID=2593676 RepID=UPI002E2CA34A|nr:ATP/GTP-binding protein [Streptomyces sp. NBC_00223]
MSPRRNRPHGGRRPADRMEEDDGGTGFGGGNTEEWQGEEWVMRPIAGSASAKHYRCPGCDQEIPPGVAHVVAWRAYGGVDDRRHWHRACWNAKDRRTSKVQRSRNAPRY